MSRRTEIAENLAKVQEQIESAARAAGREPAAVELIAVTKNFPVSDAEILYELGLRNFGENRDQEGALKAGELPSDVIWHFQGQIQSRKIPSITDWASTIHSLASIDHAHKFSTALAGRERTFFVQVNLEPERRDRGGVAPDELDRFLDQLITEQSLSPQGLMTVAPIDMEPSRAFEQLQVIHEKMLQSFPTVTKLSMGMSGDFEAAVGAGATHLRIGSSILGSRGLLA